MIHSITRSVLGSKRPGRIHACAVFVIVSLVGLAVLCPAQALAQAKPTTVALAPFETLGSESKVSQKTSGLVAEALASVPGHTLIPAKTIRRTLKKNPRLRACGGNGKCVARLGRTLDARYVVFGEVGGLGAAEVIYLELIDVAQQKSIRSTTLELGGAKPADDQRAARAAAFQLLAPDAYMGKLEAKVDVENASIYVDGQRLGKSPAPPMDLSVGSHAVRITHPEFRDYVRFVDIEFDKTTTIEAGLQQYPIVATDLAQDPNRANKGTNNGRPIIYKGQEPTPWYRKWYAVAGVGTAALLGSAVLVGFLANGIDADSEKIVEPPL